MPAHLIAQEGPLEGLILTFRDGEEWIIGRDAKQADLVVENSTVSRKHARVSKTADGFFIQNLSKVNPTLVNEIPIEGRSLLKKGDRVTIGHIVFLFSGEEPESESGLSEETAPTEKKKKEKKKKKGGYNELFADLESEIPPDPEPVEETAQSMVASTPPSEEFSSSPPKTAYDTIFEDMGAEAEIPLSLMGESPLILKVIAGPNAGAEIGLEKDRTYTIGKDQTSCDIVFQDLSVSRHHAKLTVSPDGIIEIEDLGSKNGTLINGVAISGRQIVTPQDMVALGTTLFLIIDREAVQETIFSPAYPIYETPKAKAEEEAAAAAALALEEEETLVIPGDWKKQKIPPKHLIFAGSFAVIFLVIFLSFFSLFKSEKIEVVQKTSHETIKEALAPFPGVHYTFNPAGGNLFLAGHVLTGVDYQQMRYNLDQVPSIMHTENNVVIDEVVTKTTNDVLSGNPAFRSMSVTASEPGKFIAHGTVKSNADAAQLSEYFVVNFPYLDRLQNKVVIEDILTTQIQGLVYSNGFGAVTFQLINGEVVLAGRYSEKQSSEWNQLLKKINKLDGIHSVKNFAVSSLPGQAAVDLSQQYAVTGSAMQDGHGYSAIINGKLYTIGQMVDGMKITTIEPNSILLAKDGLSYKIDYTR